jgi:hypothetical protein
VFLTNALASGPAETVPTASLLHDMSVVQVLVASDAIGMGLNLNIRRIVFNTLKSYSSEMQGFAPLDPSKVKQIAGVSELTQSALRCWLTACLQGSRNAYIAPMCGVALPACILPPPIQSFALVYSCCKGVQAVLGAKARNTRTALFVCGTRKT